MKIEYGVPEGSILGILLFKINSIDMFYECEDCGTENYADDTTPYASLPILTQIFLNYK